MDLLHIVILATLVLNIFTNAEELKKPHLIFIMADDMGWNDVSFHGSDQIPTPNIDALAYNGMILNNHYMQPLCTPSRAALMSGKYPIYTGLQGLPLGANDVRFLPDGKILPEYLKDLGYTTRLVGKWHLGHSKLNHTPTYRGFDSHFGYWTGTTSYYDHILAAYSKEEGSAHYGHDLRRDTTSAWDLQGEYATTLYSEEAKRVIHEHQDPDENPLFLMMSHMAPHAANDGKLLEAPQETIDKFSYIPNVDRRTYAAMVSEMDESVGVLIQSLKDRNMLDNSIIIFTSDNGGSTIGAYPNWASNWPLRGMKQSLWEGGVRTAACIWSPLLQGKGIHTGLIHTTDWFATLISLAGGGATQLPVNGVNQWPSLVNGLPSPRKEILLNIDDEDRNSAIIRENWKLTVGMALDGRFDVYMGDKGTEMSRSSNFGISDVKNSLAGRALSESGYTFEDAFAQNLRKESIPKCHTRERANRDVRSTCNPRNALLNNICTQTSWKDFKWIGQSQTKLWREDSLCLFDLSKDPCETRDLSLQKPAIVLELIRSIRNYRRGLVPQALTSLDPRGLPEYYNFTWSNWLDQEPTTNFF